MKNKLYLISQPAVNVDYNTYDSAVVSAPDESTARHMNPDNGAAMDWSDKRWDWCHPPSQVKVEFLGETDWPAGVVCSSYNAG